MVLLSQRVNNNYPVISKLIVFKIQFVIKTYCSLGLCICLLIQEKARKDLNKIRFDY